MRSTHNLLVISDLHLGEDLNPSATEETARDLELAERHLTDFLRHYTRRRADGRPWRLVINGDMVDLMTICIYPDQHPMVRWSTCDDDERKYGLARRMDAACAKIDAVIDRHERVVQALARFLAAGNRVEIICGNHDTELHWLSVQEAFRQGVVRAWRAMPAAARAGAPPPERIGEHIGFHAWFYYEPGVAWIEHGHQYDECCSFEYNLNPVDVEGNMLVTNVDTAGMRYLTNQIPEIAPHGTEDWSFAGYMRLMYDAGMQSAWRMARGYYWFSAKLLGEWRASRRLRANHQRRAVHVQRLSALSEATDVPEATLRALDGLQRRPVVTNLRRLAQVLMLDKLALWSITALVLFLVMAALPMGLAMIAAATVLATSRLANRWLGRGRNVSPALPLDLVPERILGHVDARFVIFGHTHLPVARALTEGRWYFNTGTWMPSGKPGLLRCFTHVVLRHEPGGPVATLCQWRDGASRPFTPERTHVEPDRPPIRGLSPTPAVVARAA